MLKNNQLDTLFRKWNSAFIKEGEAGVFVSDGIVNEPIYNGRDQAGRRILLVLADANAKNKAVKRYCHDLRKMYNDQICGKRINQSIARWARLLLDNETDSFLGDPERTRGQMRRVATMNLKKSGGTHEAVNSEIEYHSRKYRSFILEQIRIIEPDILIACGDKVRNSIKHVLWEDSDQGRKISCPICWNRILVLPSTHPSWRAEGLDEIRDRTIQAAWHNLTQRWPELKVTNRVPSRLLDTLPHHSV